MSVETASHVRYIDKTRAYYQAEGYEKPYEWAHFADIPFTPFASIGRPLAQCRVGVVTTSEMARRDAAAEPDDPRRLVYALPTNLPVAELYSKKAAYDRYATTLDDVDSYLPLTHLHRFAAEGRIGAVAPRFQVIYSEYSQRKTLTVDAPEILKQMREDRVDVAILTAV
jgi:D-proline reductase (dithiol) PrdB